ncbi:MAG: hypothetical protein V9G24_05290 [Rhodoblastus sp.]
MRYWRGRLSRSATTAGCERDLETHGRDEFRIERAGNRHMRETQGARYRSAAADERDEDSRARQWPERIGCDQRRRREFAAVERDRSARAEQNGERAPSVRRILRAVAMIVDGEHGGRRQADGDAEHDRRRVEGARREPDDACRRGDAEEQDDEELAQRRCGDRRRAVGIGPGADERGDADGHDRQAAIGDDDKPGERRHERRNDRASPHARRRHQAGADKPRWTETFAAVRATPAVGGIVGEIGGDLDGDGRQRRCGHRREREAMKNRICVSRADDDWRQRQNQRLRPGAAKPQP